VNIDDGPHAATVEARRGDHTGPAVLRIRTQLVRELLGADDFEPPIHFTEDPV
jgi:hypothetical protein